MVASHKILGSRKAGDGKKGVRFSEVKAAVGTKSSEGVPDGSQSRKWRFKQETWRTSHAKCVWGGRSQREIMQVPKHRFQPGP